MDLKEEFQKSAKNLKQHDEVKHCKNDIESEGENDCSLYSESELLLKIQECKQYIDFELVFNKVVISESITTMIL